MPNPIRDGGPAFPRPVSEIAGTRNTHQSQTGMTLRAYFSGQALIGLLSDPNNMSNAEVNAQVAVVSADALIAELAKGTTQ